jgi:hypothetical protein
MASLLAKLKPKRRWVQVSLRTVLVLVTLLCIALSMWVVPAERQRRAVAAIEKLGGHVSYAAHNQAPGEASLVSLLQRNLPKDYFDHVESVDLNSTRVTDAELAHLKGLTSLQQLFLDETQVTDAGLAHLEGLRGLQRLNVIHTKITDAGLVYLQGMTNLKWLDLSRSTELADAGLVNLQGMTNLQLLSLSGSRVTDAGLAHLQGLRGLQHLILLRTKVTSAGLSELRRALPNCQIVPQRIHRTKRDVPTTNPEYPTSAD